MKKRRLVIAGLVTVVCAVIAFPLLKRHAEAVGCRHRMRAVLCLATCLWPDEHEGRLPMDFLSMAAELGSPRILHCPGDPYRHPIEDWTAFTPDRCSYEIINPGIRKGETHTVFLRCKVHGFVGYADDRLLDTPE